MTMPWLPRAASGASLLRSNSSSRTASLFALLVLGPLATTLSHAFLIFHARPGPSSIARLPASALGLSTPFCLPSSLRAVPEGLLNDDGEPQYDAPARAKIEELIKNNKIVLFMKGTRLFPSCGFSNTAIRILDQLNV
ncbi:grx5, partial [Nannochloropsis gaditana CCMP526]